MNNLKRNRYRNKTSFLREHVNLFLLLSGFAGLLIQAIKLLHDFDSISEFTWCLQSMAILFGVFYFYILGKEDAIKLSREEFKEYIDNKTSLKKLLLSILKDQVEEYRFQIPESEYNSSIKNWYDNSDEKNRIKNLFRLKQNVQSYIDDIGFEDFSYLLLTKAENSDIITVTNIDAKTFITIQVEL
jgi:hypothetical protein